MIILDHHFVAILLTEILIWAPFSQWIWLFYLNIMVLVVGLERLFQKV